MARIKFVSKKGAFERAYRAIFKGTAEAAQAAIAEAGEIAKNQARAEIAASGLGTGFINALRLNVYPKTGVSINASAQIFHKIPYAGVFEEGATIRGKPNLWIPLPDAPQRIGRKTMTPRLFEQRVGKLQFVKPAGKNPLLFAKMNVGRGKTAGKITLSRLRAAAAGKEGTKTSVPIFVGISSVAVRKRLNIRAIVQRARDRLPVIFAQKFKG